MEKGTVRVMSFREKVRKVGITFPDEENGSKRNSLDRGGASSKSNGFKSVWLVFTGFFFGHRPSSTTAADPAAAGGASSSASLDSDESTSSTSPTLKSPVVVRRLWDQSSRKYQYCGCVHVKVATMFGLFLDAVLLISYIVIIVLVSLDWQEAQTAESAFETTPQPDESNPIGGSDPWSTTEAGVSDSSTTMDPQQAELLAEIYEYESYMVATIADASLAFGATLCLLIGMCMNRPNFLVPQISLAFVMAGVKIIQLSKQVTDGIATPFVITFGVVEVLFTVWFGHVIFLYRRYMNHRNAFLLVHIHY